MKINGRDDWPDEDDKPRRWQPSRYMLRIAFVAWDALFLVWTLKTLPRWLMLSGAPWPVAYGLTIFPTIAIVGVAVVGWATTE